MRIAPLGHYQIVHCYALAVGNGEGICLDRLIDRPPHLNNREPARKQCIGLIREKLANLGMEPLMATPEQFAALMAVDLEKSAAVVKASNIKLD